MGHIWSIQHFGILFVFAGVEINNFNQKLGCKILQANWADVSQISLAGQHKPWAMELC